MSPTTTGDRAAAARESQIEHLHEELAALHKRHIPVWTDLRDGDWQWTAGDVVFRHLWFLLSDLNVSFRNLSNDPNLAPGGGPPSLRLVETRKES